MRKGQVIFGMVALSAAVATWAASPADTVKARQDNFKQIGRNFKGVMDEMKKPDASVALIQGNAKTIESLSKQVKRWFPKGSGPESGAKTGALPLIWTDAAGFSKKADDFAKAAAAFRKAADSGKMEAIKPAAMAMGGSCKGCHDTYKAKEDHHEGH